MSISVVCPNCKKTVKAKDSLAGQTLPCPGCKQPLTIVATAASGAAPRAPTPAPADAASSQVAAASPAAAAHPPSQSAASMVAGADAWFVRLPNGQQVGPVTRAALEQAALAGQAPPGSLVWQPGWPEMRPIADIVPMPGGSHLGAGSGPMAGPTPQGPAGYPQHGAAAGQPHLGQGQPALPSHPGLLPGGTVLGYPPGQPLPGGAMGPFPGGAALHGMPMAGMPVHGMAMGHNPYASPGSYVDPYAMQAPMAMGGAYGSPAAKRRKSINGALWCKVIAWIWLVFYGLFIMLELVSISLSVITLTATNPRTSGLGPVIASSCCIGLFRFVLYCLTIWFSILLIQLQKTGRIGLAVMLLLSGTMTSLAGIALLTVLYKLFPYPKMIGGLVLLLGLVHLACAIVLLAVPAMRKATS